jgi:imidazolonepropionase-like amidohydrolase
VKAGVKIVFGTDMGGIEWTEPIAQEFPYLVQFGLTAMAAIQAATSRAAEMLDMKGEIGVIAPGAYADIIAVDGDPLKSIKDLERVRFVMQNGNVFKQVR